MVLKEMTLAMIQAKRSVARCLMAMNLSSDVAP